MRDLRPRTVVKDEAIPVLLRGEQQPTFVTTNVRDFWLQVAPDPHFCIVCLPIPDDRRDGIPRLVRRIFRLPLFRSKAARMGKVVHVVANGVRFYQSPTREVETVRWSIRRG